jgi:hypothetical protein
MLPVSAPELPARRINRDRIADLSLIRTLHRTPPDHLPLRLRDYLDEVKVPNPKPRKKKAGKGEAS